MSSNDHNNIYGPMNDYMGDGTTEKINPFQISKIIDS